ncbi:MAG: type II toxin-antitoxin system RelE/ParE family toxin [Pseudomonadota bacterium]
MKLKLRAAAVRDLDAIFDYGFVNHGAERASAYLSELDAKMARLLTHPELGPPSDVRPGLRSIAEGEHRIYYRIERDTITVARVLHKAMDVERWV